MKAQTVTALFLGASLATPLAAGDWRELFNGQDLQGWRQLGGAAIFALSNGAIVGTAVPDSPNSFLVTEARYGDFILEAEILISGNLNSGFMFRADRRPDYRDGVVFGYQAEVDPGSRAFSGGIYEEQRRGWLYPLGRNPACQEAWETGEWNVFRIEAVGEQIQTWVNGVPCARLRDGELREGFIGLQVHGVDGGAQGGVNGRAGDTARWRNLRILEDPPAQALLPMPEEVVEIHYQPNSLSDWERRQGWQLLWDGVSTDGWRGARLPGFPEFGWENRDGELVVLASGGGEGRNGGDIITTRGYSNFELQLDFRISEGANSGIKYFVDPDLLKGEGSAIGLEFQILDDERHPDAKLGVAGNRTVGSLYDLIAAANLQEPGRPQKRVNPPGSWNRARIVVQGQHVEHWLNDFKVVDYERGTQMFRALVAYSKYAQWPGFGEWESGPILLQDHGDEVAFRSIKLRELEVPVVWP